MPILLLLLGAGLGVGGTLLAKGPPAPAVFWVGFVESAERSFIDGKIFTSEVLAGAFVSDVVLDTPGAVGWTYAVKEGELVPETVRQVTERRGITL